MLYLLQLYSVSGQQFEHIITGDKACTYHHFRDKTHKYEMELHQFSATKDTQECEVQWQSDSHSILSVLLTDMMQQCTTINVATYSAALICLHMAIKQKHPRLLHDHTLSWKPSNFDSVSRDKYCSILHYSPRKAPTQQVPSFPMPKEATHLISKSYQHGNDSKTKRTQTFSQQGINKHDP
jgi:hypothetical protein